MLEVEMKFPVENFAHLEEQLVQLGARRYPAIAEADHYFNAPDRDFAKTDEALRLRRIGSQNFVTYKGPKRDAQTKTRTEIEVPLAEGAGAAEKFMQLLLHLGYRAVAIVPKQRTKLRLEVESFAVEVCLDEVKGVGQFVEIEIMAGESALDVARDAVLRLAAKLGLSHSERRSYLELLLERQGKK